MNDSFKSSIDQINNFKDYMGGDNDNQPMNQFAVKDMIDLAKTCEKKDIVQPEFFPYYDASGAQAEWEYMNLYIEVDTRGNGYFDFLLIHDGDYNNPIRCFCTDVNSVAQIVKAFLKYFDVD